jgi:hypothetical protein
VSEPRNEGSAAAALTAFATATAPLATIDALRAKPGFYLGKPVPPKILKYSDEQTVVGVAAVLRAIQERGWDQRSFRDWGAVAAPRFLGRMAAAMSIAKYMQDHAYSVSPNVIPNQSLHSVSGTLSLVLSIQGPHFGVGGGPNAVPEGFLTALNVLKEYKLPGVWLLLTEFEPEPVPDDEGSCRNEVTAHAVALALEPGTGDGPTLHLSPAPRPVSEPATVRQLADYLKGPRSEPWRCDMSGLGTLEIFL